MRFETISLKSNPGSLLRWQSCIKCSICCHLQSFPVWRCEFLPGHTILKGWAVLPERHWKLRGTLTSCEHDAESTSGFQSPPQRLHCLRILLQKKSTLTVIRQSETFLLFSTKESEVVEENGLSGKEKESQSQSLRKTPKGCSPCLLVGGGATPAQSLL